MIIRDTTQATNDERCSRSTLEPFGSSKLAQAADFKRSKPVAATQCSHLCNPLAPNGVTRLGLGEAWRLELATAPEAKLSPDSDKAQGNPARILQALTGSKGAFPHQRLPPSTPVRPYSYWRNSVQSARRSRAAHLLACQLRPPRADINLCKRRIQHSSTGNCQPRDPPFILSQLPPTPEQTRSVHRRQKGWNSTTTDSEVSSSRCQCFVGSVAFRMHEVKGAWLSRGHPAICDVLSRQVVAGVLVSSLRVYL